MITTIVNVCSTPVSFWTVEKFGRRPLLIWGALGMVICQFIVAIVGVTDGTDPKAVSAMIAFICVYIFFFASTWGPVAWVVTGELFPLKARARCLSITTATNWLLNWAIAYATPYMVNAGPGNANLQSKVFFIWGSFCLVCAVFVYMCIYETKNLTLEQVDEMYSKVRFAWKSPGFVPSVHYTDVRDVAGEMKGGALEDLEANAKEKRAVHADHVERAN